MNVGIVTATFAPSRNGVATSTARFARGLRRLGHRVRVFAPDHPGAVPEDDVHRLPGLRSPATPDNPLLLPIGPLASRRLPLDGLDVLHTMHPFVAGYVARAWARRLGVPLVFTAHTQYRAYVHYAPTPAGVTAWATKHHVAAARRAEPRLHLMMAGDGPSRAALAARDEPHVRWVGPVAHRDVAACVRAADLFVSASETEVQPRTFLESLAGGTPVVAADSAAARDLAGPGLTVCGPGASSLSDAILGALRAPDPAGRRRAARAAALADVYARAIARRPRRRRPLPTAVRPAA